MGDLAAEVRAQAARLRQWADNMERLPLSWGWRDIASERRWLAESLEVMVKEHGEEEELGKRRETIRLEEAREKALAVFAECSDERVREATLDAARIYALSAVSEGAALDVVSREREVECREMSDLARKVGMIVLPYLVEARSGTAVVAADEEEGEETA